jgi:chromatin remodeling complex protein RSC6
MASLDSVVSEISSLRNELKSLTKLVRKIRAHQEDPSGEKAKARAVNNGFNRTLEISPKLREFLGLSDEESVSRSEVTRRINKYINDNGLKHPDNGRMIILDAKLVDLLAPPEGVQVTFLNIQKYLSPHYVKVVKEKEAPATPATPPAAAAASSSSEAPKKKVVRKIKLGA